MVCLLVGSASAWADNGRGRGRGGKHDRDDGQRAVRVVDGRDTQVAVHVVFTNADTRVIHEHYRPRYRNLPPGLQKKYARTGQLPPGWQKKMEPFPPDLERRMVVLPADYRRGVIDGTAVIYNPRTRVIVDATVLF
jgi:hypothetical protein